MKNSLLVGFFFLFFSYLGYGQELTVSITSSSPTLCAGAQITLTANVSGGTAPYAYRWSNGDTRSEITINNALTYRVDVFDQAGKPGHASFTAVATVKPEKPNAVNETGSVCPGGSARLVASGSNGTYDWYDANFQHKRSGAVYDTDPITQNTVFYVTTTVAGCTSDFKPVSVTLMQSPGVNTPSVCSGSRATFMASGATTYQWYDKDRNPLPQTGASFTTDPLTESTTFYVTGTTNGCTSPMVPAIANVNPKTPAPDPGGPYNACVGTKKTISLAVTANTVYYWYKEKNDIDYIISSPDFTTPVLTAVGDVTYWIEAVVGDCPSERIPVTITVSQPPPKPEAASNGPVCYNTTAELRVTNSVSGAVYKWYTSETSTVVYKTGEVITTGALLENKTFYVRAESGGGACVTDAGEVTVTVKSPVAAPSYSGVTTICAGVTTLTVNPPAGAIVNWYNTNDTDNEPTPFSHQPDFSPTVNASRSFFVSITIDGCESPRTDVPITIIPPPPPPSTASLTGGSTCIGGKALLSAPNDNHVWYSAASGGTPLFSGRVYQTDALTQTTNYWVASLGPGGCESTTRTRVTATVIAKPGMPNVSSDVTICEGTSTTLIASGSTGSYEWWSDQTDGVRLWTSASYPTPNLPETRTFWVQAVTPEGCTSDRRPVKVTITPRVTPQFAYSSGTYCTTGSPTTPTKFIPGTFSVSPAVGLTFQASDGRIDPSTSVPGVYTITFTPSNGDCNTPTSVSITITGTPIAAFSYAQQQLCGEGVATPVFDPGASAGVFSAPAGVRFIDFTTGQINLGASIPGSYRITNTITTDCGPPSEAYFDIEIVEAVKVNAGANRVIPVGQSRTLSGSVNLGLGVTWTSSNPADVFSDIHSLTPTYTPAATSGTVTLTLTSDNPPGVCGPRADQVVITIATKPNPPTVAPQSICYGAKATLLPTAPGGTYKWYRQLTDAAPFFTGPFLETDALTENTPFYVTATINDIESDHRTVLVTVKPQVPTPTVSGAGDGMVCPGRVDLTINETADVYNWYDADNRFKFQGKIYSPTVIQNTTFWAEIVVGGCNSERFRVDLTVKPTASVNPGLPGQVCSGIPQNHTITGNNPAATFAYSRAFVNGISEPALPNTPGSLITETLTNTTNNELIVEYIITPYLGDCAGTPVPYRVTVLPTPAIAGNRTKTVANRASIDYFVDVRPNVTSYFSWSRDQVEGINNGNVAGQESRNIRESLTNTTNLPVEVVYNFTYGTATCPGEPFSLKVTVNPPIYVRSDPLHIACSGESVNYQILSNINADAGVTFRWKRVTFLDGYPVPADFSNGNIINDVFTNTGSEKPVFYLIIPRFNGSDGDHFTLQVILKPQIPKPEILTNSPVCLDNEILLNVSGLGAINLDGAKFRFESLTGFSSGDIDEQFINIPTTSAGRVSYRVTVTIGECSVTSDYKEVEIFQKPVANAGSGQNYCPETTRIPLNGQVNGDVDGRPISGAWTIVKGKGTLELGADALVNAYIPAADDKLPGAEPVTLSLTSADRANCDPDVKTVTFTFQQLKAADAGADRGVCEQGFQLSGQLLAGNGTGSWTGGEGTFVDGRASLNGMYIPSSNELITRTVTLTLTANGASTNSCYIPSDEVVFTLLPPPTVTADASPVRYVLKGRTITLHPIVSDENVTYQWTANPASVIISDPTVRNLVVTGGEQDVIYTVTVTNALLCTSVSSDVLVKVSPQLIAPNTFTPNADGSNDLWVLQGVEAYQNVVVDIYNRLGQVVYHSVGYPKPWDGTSGGKPVPFGVYYFIIDTKEFDQKLSGYVTIVR